MKPSSSTKTSVKSDDAPKVTQADFDRAVYRVAGKNVTKPQWQAAMRARLGKQRISIMLDAPIIEHFKAAAGERGYQTLINDALRRLIDGDQTLSDMRYVLRQELAQYKIR